MCRVGTKRTATGARTVLAIATACVSLSSKVANKIYTTSPRETAMSGERLAAAGYLPAPLDGHKPMARELYNCLSTFSETLSAHGGRSDRRTMRPAILDIKKRPSVPVRERQAPALQIELELPLSAPDAAPPRPAQGSDPTVDRGIAVIDFYI
jgi:hypothetical protein